MEEKTTGFWDVVREHPKTMAIIAIFAIDGIVSIFNNVLSLSKK